MPTLTIIRGLPGSGKSTLARKLAEETGAIHIEPDMFCMQDGEYKYDPEKYGKAFDNARAIISRLAYNMECDIIFADVLPQTAQVDSFRYLIPSDYKLVVRDLKISKEESLKRNKHNVRLEDIETMAAGWQNWNSQQTTNSSQLPKLTAEVFDRPDCPKSALWATVDEDGTAYFHVFTPMLYADEWEHTNYCKKIPGKWDATNWTQIIQRPEKKTLPDWCKVGEWIYTSSEQYLKIHGISIDLQKIELSNGATWSNQDIIDEAVPARLRPYNAEEMKALMGKVIEKGPSMHIVTGFENVFDNECMVHVNGCLYGANDLLRQFTIDNKPAGVLEHHENGEWVE